MTETSQLLDAAPGAGPHATADLFPLVYNALRHLAAHRLAHEAPGQTLDPTALVHEVYLRLADGVATGPWDNRGHFFAAAAAAMRRILVDVARRKQARKHGGGMTRQPLADVAVFALEMREDVLALDAALTELAAIDAAAAEVVQLRYFGGLSIPEIASALGIAPRTADRHWAYARAWLYERIQGNAPS